MAKNRGVFVLLLDWSKSGLPRFATALAMASTTIDLLDNAVKLSSQEKRDVRDALSKIRTDSNFKTVESDIQHQLYGTSFAFELARQANRNFLNRNLRSTSSARNVFGQALAPADNDVIPQRREYLTSQIREAFTETPSGKVWVIHGSEGCGKSWVVMQTWLDLEDPPLTLFSPNATSKFLRLCRRRICDLT